jgi:hypothetical protein
MLARAIMDAAAPALPAIMAGIATTTAADGVTRIPATRIRHSTIHIGQGARTGTIRILTIKGRTTRVIPIPTRTTNQDMATTHLWLHRCSAAWVSSATIMA